MSDLEKFLQQAAERRKAKLNQPAGPPPQANAPLQPVRQRERAYPEILEPEILDEIIDRKNLGREPLKPRNISSLAQHQFTVEPSVDQADERMLERVHQVFDHQVGNLKSATNEIQPASKSISDNSPDTRQAEANAISDEVLKLLANPNALQSAFVLSEIFKPKQW